ncbi:MAG: adenylate/guanylate cyclase domain-containing protein [Actinomycetaceae bacterium]|nr:adenylate/guanylate cyclase domain-containing protein [Actinomycetaceae bacterium]
MSTIDQGSTVPPDGTSEEDPRIAAGDAVLSGTYSDSTVSAYLPHLLGGQMIYSARDIATYTGTSIESVRDFWSNMGTPVRDEEAVVYTARDLDMYSASMDLVESGAIDGATSRSLLRASSHLADRLSLWQVEALVEDAVRRHGLDDTSARIYVLDHMRERIADLERMAVHAWQRQLESLLTRMEAEVARRGLEVMSSRFPLNRSLGFVDMVSYTSTSTIMGESLVGLIQRFEDESRAAVTDAGGRVVKMIGDAVMYIADDLHTGLEVATSLMERLGADDEILPVRASFVRGDVFSRSGDVFGPTVNLAARLADIAPVGQILTDPSTAAAIAAGELGGEYVLEEFPTADVRGFGQISPYRVAPAS